MTGPGKWKDAGVVNGELEGVVMVSKPSFLFALLFCMWVCVGLHCFGDEYADVCGV